MLKCIPFKVSNTVFALCMRGRKEEKRDVSREDNSGEGGAVVGQQRGDIYYYSYLDLKKP